LGHAVVLSKLRQFQQAGHNVVFLIGDFTTLIGDPTGKSKTRPSLSRAEIERNMSTYFEQVSKILDAKVLTVRYNAEWLGKLDSRHIITLCAKVTLARLTEREDFANRIAHNQSVSMHELLYPLLQGYDSVALKADVELGGTDQTFNLLMGRFLQEHYGQEPQTILTMPLLEGIDGVQKMSQSLGNAIGLNEPADQAFGKLMSIPDSIVMRYGKLLLHYDDEKCAQAQNALNTHALHPMTFKKQVAHAIVTKFWSPAEADRAQQAFENIFQKKNYSKAVEHRLPDGFDNPVWIVDLLKEIGAAQSSSDARRLIEAGAVSIDDVIIKDFKATVAWQPGMIVKGGKLHICRIA
jgi:tyrosyl-tRNA synthetase